MVGIKLFQFIISRHLAIILDFGLVLVPQLIYGIQLNLFLYLFQVCFDFILTWVQTLLRILVNLYGFL